MNSAQHPVSIGQMPTIGMVAAPAGGGHHVGIGIGIPLMAAGSLLQTHQTSLHHHGLVSPDSSDDGLLQHRTQSPAIPQPGTPCSNIHANATSLPAWSTGPFLPGMGYPLMGLGSASLLGEHNMYYGLNLVNTHTQPQPPILSTHDLTMIPNTLPSQKSLTEGYTPIKDIVHCKSCTLFPQNPSAQLPTTREKPNGCRTVFVGGLPENITEDMLREVFERFGEITTIRMSKKNFCHIRFESESSVDGAIFFSGYRVRIGSNSDNANIGRFHVDYAQARDDYFEWGCRQRQQQREQRHRDRMEQERLIPRSPSPVVYYSEHEASVLAENIKLDESFNKSIQ